MSLSVPVTEIVETSDDPLLQRADHWDRVRLGDIADILNGYAFSSEYFNQGGEGLPLIRIRDVGSDTTDAIYAGAYDQKYIVEPGDLLIGMDGEFKSARWRGPKALLNQRVCKLTLTSEQYEPRFLDLVLPGYLDAIHRYTSSVTVKHLSSKSVANIPLPCPPPAEQKRIADKIEELFSNLDAGLDSLQTAKSQLERYRLSVLQAAVEGQLTAEWRRTHNPEPADQLLERILEERQKQWEERYRWERYESKGKEPPSGWRDRYNEPDVPDFDDSPQLPDGWCWTGLNALYEWSNGNGLPEKERKVGPYPVYGGNGVTGSHSDYMTDQSTLVIGRVGANCGNVHLAPANSWITDNAIYSVWKTDLIDHGFMKLQLKAKRLRRLAAGSGQPYLSQTKLNSIPVVLPPYEEQRVITEETERIMSVAEDSKSAAEQESRRSSRLRQSILKRAFRGELL